MSTNTQRATFKSSKPTMSKYNDKQSNYRLLNVLCRTKAVFADVYFLAFIGNYLHFLKHRDVIVKTPTA